MASEAWLTHRQWEAIARLLPSHQPGEGRVSDRRVLSGVVHMKLSLELDLKLKLKLKLELTRFRGHPEA